MNTAINSFIKSIKEGQFLTVTFIKKDGSIRTINGRFGVKKYLKGGECTLDSNKFFILFSVADKGYRAINKETVIKATCKGVTVVNNKYVDIVA